MIITLHFMSNTSIDLGHIATEINNTHAYVSTKAYLRRGINLPLNNSPKNFTGSCDIILQIPSMTDVNKANML